MVLGFFSAFYYPSVETIFFSFVWWLILNGGWHSMAQYLSFRVLEKKQVSSPQCFCDGRKRRKERKEGRKGHDRLCNPISPLRRLNTATNVCKVHLLQRYGAGLVHAAVPALGCWRNRQQHQPCASQVPASIGQCRASARVIQRRTEGRSTWAAQWVETGVVTQDG